jgi:hypothetical protein
VEYWNFREDISVENGILFKCDRIIILDSLRNDILKTIHQGHPRIEYPWQRLASDLFEHKQVHYLLYSKFPVARRLGKSLSLETIIAFTKSVICEFGIPEELVSDNGPQYDSHAWKSFCATYGIKHTTSSPHYAQSNGMVERCAQTVKKLIIKSLYAGEDTNIALLNYRSTPVSSSIASPAKLLMSRELRTTMPMKR